MSCGGAGSWQVPFGGAQAASSSGMASVKARKFGLQIMAYLLSECLVLGADRPLHFDDAGFLGWPLVLGVLVTGVEPVAEDARDGEHDRERLPVIQDHLRPSRHIAISSFRRLMW